MPWPPRRTPSRLFPPEQADLAFATFLLKILAPGTFIRDRPDRASPRKTKKSGDFPARKPGEPSVTNVIRKIEFHLLSLHIHAKGVTYEQEWTLTLTAAQVHATLAVAAAIAVGTAGPDGHAWADVAATRLSARKQEPSTESPPGHDPGCDGPRRCSLSDSLGNLTVLTRISMYGNELVSLPDVLGKLPRLCSDLSWASLPS